MFVFFSKDFLQGIHQYWYPVIQNALQIADILAQHGIEFMAFGSFSNNP